LRNLLYIAGHENIVNCRFSTQMKLKITIYSFQGQKSLADFNVLETLVLHNLGTDT
jgi:hypothetical protein